MNLKQFLGIADFTHFPFDIKPAKWASVWAGRPRILQELVLFMDNVITNGLSEFGVVTGRRGSGKSHTLLHLRYLVEQTEQAGAQPSLCLYIENPIGMGSKGTFAENYRYLLNTVLGKRKAQSIFKSAMQELKRRVVLIRKSSGSDSDESVRSQVYEDIVGDSPITWDLFNAILNDSDKWWEWLSGGSRISKVGDIAVQTLTSHVLCAKSLATIMKLATLIDANSKPVNYNAVFVLVDQTEDLARLPGGAFQDQIVGWRTLVDEMDSRFGMLWAMEGSAEEIEASFTEAIQRRQTTDPGKLTLFPFGTLEAMEFLIQIMSTFRKDGSRLHRTYPFEPSALAEIVSKTRNKTPSQLLLNCRLIVLWAIRKDIITKKGDKILSKHASAYFRSG